MKKTLADLAILGGNPAFYTMLHVGRPTIGNRTSFIHRVNNILDTRCFTNRGPYVQEFEQKISELLGVKHCVAMCNGTVALEIAIRAAELTGEVIIPSFTFVATAHALQWQEITPVFCDIDPHTHNIDPDKIESLITPRTTGIIGVHVWGRPCNVEVLSKIAHDRHLKLLYDSAHAFYCSWKGLMIGNFGDAEILSFHATKFFNTFEGGAVVTNDDKMAEKIRLMSNFGFSGLDNVIYIGMNGKMNEICAAMGLSSLEALSELVQINWRNYRAYSRHLQGIPGCKLVAHSETEKTNAQYIIIEIDECAAGIGRDLLVKILHVENIRARRYFYPGCHQMEPYRSYYPNAGLLLPETEMLTTRVLCLPTGPTIGESDVETICDVIRFAINKSTQIKKAYQEKN
jgi:dTDP-4-amino-4,6-dideoxygalactose transaminase